jgi:predicted ATPase
MFLAIAVRYRNGVPIPDALRAAVLRRLERLRRPERAVIMRAAVIGRSFDVGTLLAAALQTEAMVRAALARASALQLIVASPGDRYSFRHALTQDIVYAEFAGGTVRPLHARIARALECRFERGEPVLAELAYHAWASRDSKRALRYNELAGDEAAGVHAYDDARLYYGRARSLIEIGRTEYTRLTEKLAAIEGTR